MLDNLKKRFPDTARSDLVAAIKTADGQHTQEKQLVRT